MFPDPGCCPGLATVRAFSAQGSGFRKLLTFLCLGLPWRSSFRGLVHRPRNLSFFSNQPEWRSLTCKIGFGIATPHNPSGVAIFRHPNLQALKAPSVTSPGQRPGYRLHISLSALKGRKVLAPFRREAPKKYSLRGSSGRRLHPSLALLWSPCENWKPSSLQGVP